MYFNRLGLDRGNSKSSSDTGGSNTMADSFDCFSALFGKGEVFINGKTFPLGQCSTDILNIDGEVLAELDRRIAKLMPTVESLLQEKTDSAARSAQEQLSAVWDLIFSFPVYRDLNMDTLTAFNLFPLLLSDPEKWVEVQEVGTEGHAMFQKLMEGLEYFPESLRTFRGQVTGMLELYFEPLARRSTDA
ncbi:MAG: hypothetical protein VB055_10965, partial [Oscillospiraceae bacterium]|nr:hypothetical protein [Oscillospiraceae bacterium]